MPRLWGRVIREHRTVASETQPCEAGDITAALTELCRGFDIPYPVWLRKHDNEFAQFRRTTFKQEHFMEPIDFDQLEIEYLEDEDRKRRSRDPRNQF